MNFREKVLGIIFIIMGLSLGWIMSAHGESPGPFFKKNLATCFYCNSDNSIYPGFTVGIPNMENLRTATAVSNSSNSKTTQSSAKESVVQPPLPGVDEKAPEAFKNFVRAYASGDMNAAYEQAKLWIKYQDMVLKRTSDLSTLIGKARLELAAAEEMGKEGNYGSEEESSPESRINPLRIYFFFDIHSATAEQTVNEVQSFYASTISRPEIEIIGIADGEVTIDDLEALKESTRISFPVKFDQELANALEISDLPTLVAIADGQGAPCRYEGTIEKERLTDFVQFCSARAKAGRAYLNRITGNSGEEK